jgi:hypothetical protein
MYLGMERLTSTADELAVTLARPGDRSSSS